MALSLIQKTTNTGNHFHIPQTIFYQMRLWHKILLSEFQQKKLICEGQEVAKQAQIHRTIKSWKHGYGTIVGERGVKLSSGQRQRIGIARALYKGAKVLILTKQRAPLTHQPRELYGRYI